MACVKWPFFRLSQFLAWFLFILVYKFRCFGRDKLPCRGGCIIACSHQSFLDPVIIGFTSRRPVNYLARSTLFKNPIFAAIIRFYGAMELERGEADVKALKKCVEKLKRGGVVLLFPEGTRTRTGEIGPVKPGVFLMSSKAGVPVIPASIEGALKVWPRGKVLPGLGKLGVAYGEPLQPTEGGGASYRILAGKLRQRLEKLRARIGAVG